MDELVNAVYHLVKTQHVSKINALAARIRATPSEDAAALANYFSTDAANRALENMLKHWQRLGCSSEELAGLLIGSSYGYLSEKAEEVVQLVWTGPDTNLIPVRRSEQVLLEVINTAQESLFIVSFVLINIPAVEAAISKAVSRGVDVRILLESEDKDNSGSFRDTIERLQAEIPGLTLYIWPREKREGTEGGFARVHAKCAVADQTHAFLTSANLTSAALDKNIEMGVHIRGGSIPQTICQQFIGLIRVDEIFPFSVNRYKSKKKAAVTALEKLEVGLVAGSELLLSFKNNNLGIEETRRFRVLSSDDGKPKANSVVLMRHKGQWIVGKYAWSKQQESEGGEGGRVFYLISVRGFGPTQKIEVEDSDWDTFMPAAVESIE